MQMKLNDQYRHLSIVSLIILAILYLFYYEIVPFTQATSQIKADINLLKNRSEQYSNEHKSYEIGQSNQLLPLSDLQIHVMQSLNLLAFKFNLNFQNITFSKRNSSLRLPMLTLELEVNGSVESMSKLVSALFQSEFPFQLLSLKYVAKKRSLYLSMNIFPVRRSSSEPMMLHFGQPKCRLSTKIGAENIAILSKFSIEDVKFFGKLNLGKKQAAIISFGDMHAFLVQNHTLIGKERAEIISINQHGLTLLLPSKALIRIP